MLLSFNKCSISALTAPIYQCGGGGGGGGGSSVSGRDAVGENSEL